MEAETEAMLELIRNFLRRDDVASRELWDVLAALRGPDDDDTEALKSATTGVIRQRVFGKDAGIESCGQHMLNGALFDPDDEECAKIRHMVERTHFTNHARKAFKVLGLNWHEVNEP